MNELWLGDDQNSKDRKTLSIHQANRLARSVGSLTLTEQRLFDYCVTFIKKHDKQNQVYSTSVQEIVETLGIEKGGMSYKQVIKAVNSLESKTGMWLPIIDPNSGARGVMKIRVLQSPQIFENGIVKFQFHPDIEEHLFNLTKEFYAIPFSELIRYKNPRTITLLKLWKAQEGLNRAHGITPGIVRIKGTFDEFKVWFLGGEIAENEERNRAWPAGKFKQRVLDKVINEFREKNPTKTIDLTIFRKGKGNKVIGYEFIIIDKQYKAYIEKNR